MTPPWLKRNAPPRGIQLNWENLKDNLAGIDRPHLIVGIADRVDIEEYQDHLRKVLTEVTKYAKALVGELAYRASTNIPDNTELLEDAIGDICGALRNKADALLVDEVA